MVQWLIRAILGPKVWIWFPLLVAVGVALLLGAPSKNEVGSAHAMFAVAFLLLAGNRILWLTSLTDPPIYRPVIAFAVFGLIGGLWMLAYDLAESKTPPTPSTPTPQAKATPTETAVLQVTGDYVAGDKVGGDKVMGNKIIYVGPTDEQLKRTFREIQREDKNHLQKEYPEGYQVFGVAPEGFIVPAEETPKNFAVKWQSGRVEDFSGQQVTVVLPDMEFSTPNIKHGHISGNRITLPKSPLRNPFKIYDLVGYVIYVEVLAVRTDLVVVGVGIKAPVTRTSR